MFKSDRTSLKHVKGAGRSSTSTTDDNIQQAREMVVVNRQVTIDEVVYALHMSHSSAHQIIYDEHGFHKVGSQFVPRKLTVEQKLSPVRVCRRLLNRSSKQKSHRRQNMGSSLPARIKTLEYGEEETLDLQRGKKFKTSPCSGKVMRTTIHIAT
ncbi:hypothetical protein AVEN_171444-1 [Araneus ventricosus]|uniref:Uncharacterized protein n=1 Tax=Araneus ventricosus TaxID=182803 RepID=A0A4Y2D4Q7_ARAVE|nr:hypothetical protein AVEN_171444-1 [Araneus ventricosus]